MPKDANAIWREQLRKRLDECIESSRPLLADRRFDDAEKRVRAVDGDIYGMLALARMYEAHLRMLVERGESDRDRVSVEAVFQRALQWAQRAYPAPHTQIEADNYSAGQEEDRARLVKILSYEPRGE